MALSDCGVERRDIYVSDDSPLVSLPSVKPGVRDSNSLTIFRCSPSLFFCISQLCGRYSKPLPVYKKRKRTAHERGHRIDYLPFRSIFHPFMDNDDDLSVLFPRNFARKRYADKTGDSLPRSLLLSLVVGVI